MAAGVPIVGVAIALVALTAIWLALTALIRWVIRWVLPTVRTTISWTIGMLASGGVLFILTLVFLVPMIRPQYLREMPLMQAEPPSPPPPPVSMVPPSETPPPSVAKAAPPPSAMKAAPPPADFSVPPDEALPHYYTAAPPTPKGPQAADSSASSSTGYTYPQFPWPPPPPSGEIVVPNEVLLAGLSHPALGDIARLLVQALQHAGYYQSVYYEAPHGFALVARLERIHPDGSPYQGTARFDSRFSPLPEFSLSGYLHALFRAPTGYYRVIAFIISDTPFAATGTPVSSQEANMWLEHGANALPLRIADVGYSVGYACTALIYEFQKQDAQSDPVEDTPGLLSADTHLVKAKIAEALKWQLH